MSFFSLSSSSTSPNPPVDIRRSMTALPTGQYSARPSTSLKLNNSKSKGSKLKQSEVIGRYFNTVAGRPMSTIIVPAQIYRAHLTLVNNSIFTTSTVSPAFGSNSFALSDFVNSTQYTGCFDQYRLEEFEVWIEPNVSQSTAIANVGTITTAVDVDDVSTPTTFSSVAGKQNSLQSSALDGQYHRWIPHVAEALYSGAFTSYGNIGPVWIDCASPSVAHYGLKYAAGVTSVAISYQITVKAKMSFRQAGI